MTNNPPAYPFLNLFPALQGQRVVLASTSPQRKNLLGQIGLVPECIASGFPENLSKEDLTPWEYVTQTATQKALKCYEAHADDANEPKLVIAADTIVLAGTNILEKPKNPMDQMSMLKTLRQNPHRVYTAVAVLQPMDDMPVAPGYILKTHLEETEVHFDSSISDDVLAAYVQSGEGTLAAGGYKIQGQAGLFIEKIVGDYSNVVGLPLNATYRLIHSVLTHDIYDENVNF